MPGILVIGPTGQIGYELCRALHGRGDFATAGRRNADLPLDLTDPDSIRSALSTSRPEIVINAAAYTAVDQAEREPDLAFAVNRDGPGILAEMAARQDALMVHFSTDYVFDGSASDAYREQDPPNPLSVYGRSKLAGEQAVRAAGGRHVILRTSWVYGLRGRNFLTTILRLAEGQNSLRVVDDQLGVPNWCGWVANATVTAIRGAATRGPGDHGLGLYHLSAAGETSWHGFASEILDSIRNTRETRARTVTPIPSSEYATAATRPARSTLDASSFAGDFGIDIPHWRDCLQQCLAAGNT